eukprot:Seg5975.1 transcript_id=Seg5975.1/GoldUCD/mRNA.D3Y31 product="Werner syndrome ATP-dependent helicase" protein_id=Seg5975.1/GoldUCD/D3Y31
MSKTRTLPAWMVKGADPNLHEKSMPFLKFQGRIHYIDNKHDCNFICQNIIETKQTACGFDIEWKVSYKAGEGMRDTAVFQICSSEMDCYVFQVSAMNGFPIALKSLVEDATIIKAGVGIRGDMSKISLEYKLKPDGVADLSTMLNEIKSINENWSLNGMLVHLLKKRLNKDPTIRCSNWERYPLTHDQLEYAATDAYASWLLYCEIKKL